MATCPNCSGSGVIPGDSTCPLCHGLGGLELGPNIAGTCPACHGSGIKPPNYDPNDWAGS